MMIFLSKFLRSIYSSIKIDAHFHSGLIYLSLVFLLVGCASSMQERYARMDRITNEHHFAKKLVKTAGFTLVTYQKITNPKESIVFYIESDGRISSGYGLADNPTPGDSMLIKLAVIDPRPNVVYIARPCQYTSLQENPKCSNNAYWSTARMSKEVVDSVNNAICQINQQYDNKPFSLVGHSGGGGIAVLVAAENHNVKDIITIAANLDSDAFTAFHRQRHPNILPMSQSLNPIVFAAPLRNVPQLHLAGANDDIVPPFIAQKYVNAANSTNVKTEIIPNTTHSKGWKEQWLKIISSSNLR